MHPWERELYMWQVVVEVPGMPRMIVGPYPSDQEDEARAVYEAWVKVSSEVMMKPTLEGFTVSVVLQAYQPLLPNADPDWLYSRYVQPALLEHGTKAD